MLAFCHHRLVHRLLDLSDPHVAVIAYKAVIIFIDLGVFLDRIDIIAFAVIPLGILDVACCGLNKIKLSEKRVSSRSKITDWLELLKEIHNDRLLDLAQ